MSGLFFPPEQTWLVGDRSVYENASNARNGCFVVVFVKTVVYPKYQYTQRRILTSPKSISISRHEHLAVFS